MAEDVVHVHTIIQKLCSTSLFVYFENKRYYLFRFKRTKNSSKFSRKKGIREALSPVKTLRDQRS